MTLQELPELLTIREVTLLLRIHPNTLRNWERDGQIDVLRIGKRGDRRYKKEVIRKLLEERL